MAKTPIPHRRILHGAVLLLAGLLSPVGVAQAPQVTGILETGHVVTLTFQGPTTFSDSSGANPFRNRRLDVTFTLGGRQLVVPGYFAADGNAALSSATTGTAWRVHFVADQPGTWTWRASFRRGTGVAIAANSNAGSPTAFDGTTGTLVIGPSSAPADSPRSRGMLRYVGERYMRYAATGEVFLEAGPNSPENLLACEDFDGTQDLGGVVSNFLHSFAPHDADFARLGGGPTWGPDRGTGILGAISYLAEQELTSMYVLLLSREGDGDDVWPWSMPSDPLRFDCSKLDQWARVFDHATERGIHLQLVLTETENESYFEFQDGTGTTFADSRKLYYREMVARFGQTLALTWNLGEENGWSDGSGPRAGNTDSQRRAFSAWLANLDPYDHPIIVHTYHGPATGQDQDGVNMPLTDPANPALEIDGASLQGPYIPSQSVLAPSNDLLRNNHAKALYWIQRSQAAGHPWVVAHHEQMPAILGTSDDSDSADPNHDTIRKDMLWGTLMAGGGGVQYYFGYKYRLGTGGSQSGDDLTAEDFRPRADLWRQSRIALRFFREHVPVERLDCIDALVGDPLAYCMAAPGDFYCVYFRSVNTPVLNLGSFPHSYEVLWFDPYAGGVLQQGTVAHVAGPGQQSLGMPPGNAGNDWVALVRRVDEVPGSGCPGAAYVQATGPARLGASLGLTLPPPAFPQTSPLLLLGVPPTAPVFLPAALTCGGSAACRFDIDVLQSVAAASLPGIPIPNDPGLLGAELAVAGAYASAPPVCVDLTGALLLPFVR